MNEIKKKSVWDRWNPKQYLLEIVQWEDRKRFVGVELYEMKPLKFKVEKKGRPWFYIGNVSLNILP